MTESPRFQIHLSSFLMEVVLGYLVGTSHLAWSSPAFKLLCPHFPRLSNSSNFMLPLAWPKNLAVIFALSFTPYTRGGCQLHFQNTSRTWRLLSASLLPPALLARVLQQPPKWSLCFLLDVSACPYPLPQ